MSQQLDGQGEAHQALGRPIGYTTMQTRLNRLVVKGVVTRLEERPARYAAVLAASFAAALAVLALPTGGAIRAALGSELGAVLFVAAAMSWALFQFQDPVLVSLDQARWVPW